MLAFYVDREVWARKSWELGGNIYTKRSKSLNSLSEYSVLWVQQDLKVVLQVLQD